jgi:hypothetical protein
MSSTELAFGKRVIWRNLRAEIVDIRWAATPLVQIRVVGGHTHWTTPDRLEVADVSRER